MSPSHPSSASVGLLGEPALLFGGDYNPEQWSRETWREDVALMQRAGVNLVTVGVFSWAEIEPAPGVRAFGWLDEVLDLLHAGGIAVDLATPTASPPPWLGVAHPDILPVDRDGVRLIAGSRNQFSPASEVYRAHARAITRDLAERYAGHPAVRMWHVGNEFGQLDHGDEAAREFRRWLRETYGTIDALNAAWATAFWAQRYGSFDEILPPRRMPYLVNPAQALDFRRYSSDQMRTCYRELRDEIRATGATQPITTNFMGLFAHVDYWSWAADVDVVSDDQYPDPADPQAPAETALVQDLMRSLGGGRSWMLMEQAVSAVSWRPHNLPKSPQHAWLDTLQAVARGADGVCFFQWRQAAAGAERFHSAMLPHAGADTEVFAGVCRQGEMLRALAPVAGSRVVADVALVFDWDSWWAGEEPARPTERLSTVAELSRWHAHLRRRGIATDVAGPQTDLTAYRVVLVPHSYIVSPRLATALENVVDRGGQVVIGPFSGVADASAHILQGRSPVLLRDLIGVSGEEWCALPDEPTPLEVAADAGTSATGATGHTARILGEKLRLDDAEGTAVLARFADGLLAGRPAVARRTGSGGGAATYLGAVVSDGLLAGLLDRALAEAGVVGVVPGAHLLPPGLDAVRRGDHLFLLNRGDSDAVLDLPGERIDLLSDERLTGPVVVAAGDARVLTERPQP